MDRIWKFAIIIATIVIADQITKGIVQSNFMVGESVSVIEGFFNFTYVRNQGAAFGFGATSARCRGRRPRANHASARVTTRGTELQGQSGHRTVATYSALPPQRV